MFFLIPISRIECIPFYNIAWYIINLIDFIFIIYIIYNKFIIFLSYFDHDSKYPNFIRIVFGRCP